MEGTSRRRTENMGSSNICHSPHLSSIPHRISIVQTKQEVSPLKMNHLDMENKVIGMCSISTERVGGEEDEPPPADASLCHGGVRRMVSRVASYFSLFEGRENHDGGHCVFRKSLGIMGSVEFRP